MGDLQSHLLKVMTKIIASDKYTRESVISFGEFLQSVRKIAICAIMHLTLILTNGVVGVRGKDLKFTICFLAGNVCSMDICTSLEGSLSRQTRRHGLIELITISYLMVAPLKQQHGTQN